TVVNAGSLAATWQTESLPQDMGVQLNFALLMGAAVLLLKNVPEAQLNQLQVALEVILNETSPKYLYKSEQGIVMFAVTPQEQMKVLVCLFGEIIGTLAPGGGEGNGSAGGWPPGAGPGSGGTLPVSPPSVPPSRSI